MFHKSQILLLWNSTIYPKTFLMFLDETTFFRMDPYNNLKYISFQPSILCDSLFFVHFQDWIQLFLMV